MIENLLHADVVLSKQDVKRLQSAMIEFATGLKPVTIATITFIAIQPAIQRVTLLLRMDPIYWLPIGLDPLRDAFVDGKISHELGNTLAEEDGVRTREVIEIKLNSPLRNPKGFILSKARTLARKVVEDLLNKKAEEEQLDEDDFPEDLREWTI